MPSFMVASTLDVALGAAEGDCKVRPLPMGTQHCRLKGSSDWFCDSRGRSWRRVGPPTWQLISCACLIFTKLRRWWWRTRVPRGWATAATAFAASTGLTRRQTMGTETCRLAPGYVRMCPWVEPPVAEAA